MCTVLLRFASGTPPPLLPGAVRDEFVHRAWDPPRAPWGDRPRGGRDRTARALPEPAGRRRDRAHKPGGGPPPGIGRLLPRRDIPLREKTLWRMLYETAARAGEILAFNIEDLALEARRARVVSK